MLLIGGSNEWLPTTIASFYAIQSRGRRDIMTMMDPEEEGGLQAPYVKQRLHSVRGVMQPQSMLIPSRHGGGIDRRHTGRQDQ